MTSLTVESLFIPYFILEIIFLSMFVLLSEFALPKRKSFVWGMLLGIFIYSMLIFGSDVKSMESLPEWIVKFASVLYGSVLYITLIIMVAVGAILHQFTNRINVNFLSGVTIPFSIFEAYFAFTCVGNVPFMDNLLNCT